MTRRRKIGYWLLAAAIIGLAWFVYNYPDWIVAGPPKDFKFNQAAGALPLVQSAIAEKPVTSTVQQPSNSPAPVEKPRPVQPQSSTETPKPLPTGRPDDAQYNVLAGGFSNRCYYMGGGEYTTVIMSGWDPSDHTTFPYSGELDDHNAPATAVGSRAWCTDNDPYRAER